MDLKFNLNHENAKLPERGSKQAAGLDLYAVDTHVIPPHERALINTGVSVQLAYSTYMRIAPRSGMAYKCGIDVMAGVIDSDYRGDIGVILINHGDEDYIVHVGDKIAQGIISPIILAEPSIGDMSSTERGADGFGSTGS